MSRTVPDIVEDWTKLISIDVNGKNLVTVINETTFETCNTYWAVQCGYVIIDNVEYLIKSVIQDVSITIIGSPIVTDPLLFNWGLKVPFFIHGTPRQANQERELQRSVTVKVTPMIYLFEPIREDFNEDTNRIERSVSIRLAILHNYTNDQCTDQIYDTSIRAMRKLSEKLIEVIKNQYSEAEKDTLTYKFTSYAKYGQFIDKSGSSKNLFNENLSGIELNANIELKRQDKCLSLCN